MLLSIKHTMKVVPVMVLCLLGMQSAMGQETVEKNKAASPFHNQLFFNRFLINPTFSLVRENKSYLNILHRNQYASYEDNIQNYYLGFSNKLNESTALGMGIYGQWEGVMQEFGFNANYVTSVRLSEKSRLSFGTNFTYKSQGLDKSKVVVLENEPSIEEARKESSIAMQPGMALSVGKFDFGIYAANLLHYNQTSNDLVTNFNGKSLRASMQYTHTLGVQRGLFANARIMPLVQLGQNGDNEWAYIVSVLFDLPNYGWLQTTYDDEYGLSLGLGFNLSKKMSLGYLMERNLTDVGGNLGWNHELSLAYTFKEDTPGALEYGQVSVDKRIDEIVRNYEEQILQLKAQAQGRTKTATKEKEHVTEESVTSLAYENRMLLDELILRQDSIEEMRNKLFEQQFETIVRLIRNETKQNIEQTLQGQRATPTPTVLASTTNAPSMTDGMVVAREERFLELPIRARNRSDNTGVDSGYYLIVNVYKNKKYLTTFVDNLIKQGLDARQFYNKENGLYYVYLADFQTKREADIAAHTHLGGQYSDEKWIMQVYDPMATAEVNLEEH